MYSGALSYERGTPAAGILSFVLSVSIFQLHSTIPLPLPKFSPRPTSGSVGNRAVPALKFPLEIGLCLH